jgi:polar amino acid transport system substrate-binding protein
MGGIFLWSLSLWTMALESTPAVKTSGQEANVIKFDPKNSAAPGLSMEVINALARVDPGLSFVGQDVMRPVRRVELELTSGDMEVFFGLVRNEARESQFTVIKSPALYVQFTQIAVAANDTIDIQSLDDIRKLGPNGIIGVPQGSAFVEFLKSQGGLTIDDGTVSLSSTLKKMLVGRVRFVYFGGAVLKKQIEDDGLVGKVRVLPKRYKSEEVCVMFSKNASPKLVERIQRGLNLLQRSGELDQIRTKYGVSAS